MCHDDPRLTAIPHDQDPVRHLLSSPSCTLLIGYNNVEIKRGPRQSPALEGLPDNFLSVIFDFYIEILNPMGCSVKQIHTHQW
jgi:hypothetical protein